VIVKGSKHVKEVQDISSFSSVFLSSGHLLTASLVSNIKGIHFNLLRVSLERSETGFLELGEQTYYLSPVDGVYLDTSASIIKCVEAGTSAIDCFVATTGMFSFLANIKFSELAKRQKGSQEPFVLDSSKVI